MACHEQGSEPDRLPRYLDGHSHRLSEHLEVALVDPVGDVGHPQALAAGRNDVEDEEPLCVGDAHTRPVDGNQGSLDGCPGLRVDDLAADGRLGLGRNRQRVSSECAECGQEGPTGPLHPCLRPVREPPWAILRVWIQIYIVPDLGLYLRPQTVARRSPSRTKRAGRTLPRTKVRRRQPWSKDL